LFLSLIITNVVKVAHHFFITICAASNSGGMENLYERYSKDMFKVAFRILDDYQLAQDAVQSAFINIIDSIDKIDEVDCNRTRAFVVIIVRNISINLYRKRKKQKDLVLDDIEEILTNSKENIDESIINEETFNNIATAIKELHPTYADVISLKYFYDYSDKEIGKMLNISHGNVRIRLYRARQNLIKLLSKSGELSKSE
ncbi:MAG: RNA polymerase sigma factor, partial [Ruminiclostridium sp.]